MSTNASDGTPLRVAVIGSGPSGFYVVQSLLKAKVGATIDLFDRLPSPYGLVRYGVAPDHQKIKNVTKVYARTATDPAVRYFGNVEVGRDITVAELEDHYHQVVWCTGAQTDRRLGIPGEDLEGSHPATEFVAWYNGHPDYRTCSFDLSCERAVVVGVGNVAIDVARILARTPEELARTDVADYALDALANSGIKEVLLVGRRGPAQAKFTNSEIDELGQLEGADAVTLPAEVALDAVSRAELEATPDRQTETKVARLQEYGEPRAEPKQRRVVIRFLLSPTELVDEGTGRVGSVRFVKNELYRTDDGSLRSRATNETEVADAGLVFRSVGYRGLPLPGVPFRDDWGTIPNETGHVLDAPDGAPVRGHYTAGWIKRGPSGVIGTNRPDAQETVNTMLADREAGGLLSPSTTDPEAIVQLLEARGVSYLAFPEWERLDAEEVRRGETLGRPRVKFTSREEIAAWLEDEDGIPEVETLPRRVSKPSPGPLMASGTRFGVGAGSAWWPGPADLPASAGLRPTPSVGFRPHSLPRRMIGRENVKTFLVFVVGLLIGVVGASMLMVWNAPSLMIQERVSPVGVEETVDRLVKVAEADGWKVLGIRKLHESVKKHADLDVLPVHLVDLCQPHHAGKILADDDARSVTVFMPCTVSVFSRSDGKTYVTATNAELLGTLFGGTVKEVMAGAVAESQTKFIDTATAPVSDDPALPATPDSEEAPAPAAEPAEAAETE